MLIFDIGKLSAKIPWSNIYTQPVEVTIEDVFALASPVTGKILVVLKSGNNLNRTLFFLGANYGNTIDVFLVSSFSSF